MRQDIYRHGDKVELDPTFDMTFMFKDLLGRQFSILKIIEVDRDFKSVGHPQWIEIDVDQPNKRFSGAFFKPIRTGAAS